MISSKRVFVLLILVVYSITLTSQNVTLKGFVKDNQQNPLVNTNIIALPSNSSQKMSFAIADNNGKYLLKLVKGSTYYLTVSYLGFNSIKDTLILSSDTKKNFILQESTNTLDEVVIELPVIIKRDTIIYNTTHFVTGRERKLKNVLKTLPGVEVDKSGDVIVNGKKVTKMLVDGKSFFGGNSKLAVDNIPADAVDKIEVLDNYNEVEFLKNIADTDEMAMNVKLKEDKKRFVFGEIELGKGNAFTKKDIDFYKANSNLFYYSPKTNLNFIGNLNNTAEETFSFDNFLSFQGGLNAIFKDGFKFDKAEFSQFIVSPDLIESNQKFGALNIIKATSDKTDFSTYFILSDRNTKSLFETDNNYIEFNEQKVDKNKLNNFIGIGNLKFEFKPNFNERFYFKTQIKKNDNSKNNQVSSITNFSEKLIELKKSNKNWYLNSSFEWHKKHSKQHTFSALANYIFDKRDALNLWLSNDTILQNLIPKANKGFTDLQQIMDSKKNSLYSVFKDFWILNKDNHIYTTIGNNYLNDTFISRDHQVLENGINNSLSLEGFDSNTNLKYNDLFLKLQYKFRTGIFTFKQGVNIHNYNWVLINQENKIIKNRWFVLPNLLINMEFNQSKNIQLNYKLKTNFSNASKLADRFYLRSYNSIFKGNSNLENELFHFASFRYKRFSIYRGLMLFLNLSYEKKVKGYRNKISFEKVNRVTSIELVNNANERLDINTSFRKKVRKIRYNILGKYSNYKFMQLVNNRSLKNINENYSIQFGIETVFNNSPNLELKFKKSIGNYGNNNIKSKFITDEPSLNLNYNFFEMFDFSFDWVYYNYTNKEQNIKSDYNIANTLFSYKKENSAWSFNFYINNIFNTQFKQTSNFSEYLISDTKSYIMPRRILFSVKYDL